MHIIFILKTCNVTEQMKITIILFIILSVIIRRTFFNYGHAIKIIILCLFIRLDIVVLTS